MIVFDSSTLILLAKAEILDDFLDDYNGTVIIPGEVELESCGRKKTFDALLIKSRVKEKSIEVAKISDAGLCGRLIRDFHIGKGEAQAIVMAMEKGAKLVATDDRNAIRACKMMKIPFTSAMAILVRMTGKGVVDAPRAKAALDSLIVCGRYSEEIIKRARRKMGV